jgi:hypothetical protein
MSTAEARRMRLEEASAIIQYFTTATPEHLELRRLGLALFHQPFSISP